MFDLLANYLPSNNELPFVDRKRIPTKSEGDPLVQVSKDEQAQLIMRRLVDAYLAHRPVFNAADS